MSRSGEASSVNSGLLNGLRVVEAGSSVAPGLVGMMLAEQGAEVIRVVRRTDSSEDPVLEAMLARGKKELSVNPKEPADLALLRGLMTHADVVIDGWSSGDWASADVDLELLREVSNPELVACRIGAFPSNDPRSHLPGYEPVAGMASFLYDKPLGKPRYHEFAVLSVIAGLYGACAVMAALIARGRTGRGQQVEVSLYESGLFAQILQILVKTGVPRGFLPLKMVGTPFMSPWLCGDGRYIYLHITLPAHNARILEVLEELGYGKEVRELRRIMSEETRRDPSQVKSIAEAKRIRTAYEGIFATKGADEWEKILGEELCCIKVRTIDEWVKDSRDAGMTDVGEVEDPDFGELTVLGPAVTVPSHPPVFRGREAAEEGVLERWSQAAAKAREREAGASKREVIRHPLEGIRVLDLSRVIAGPCAARVLAELGADVVSLQSPTNLDWALSFHLVFNPGKKSVTLDFRDDAGKERLWKAIEGFGPDVIVQNYRHLDVAREIGIDPEAVQRRIPNIVYTHLNAYGNEGGWRDRPGFEQVVQAVTGVQMAYAKEGKPRLLPSPIIDIGCGLAGALSSLLGLYHRQRTAQGVFGTSHLTSIAVYFQMAGVAASQRGDRLRAASTAGKKVVFDPARQVVATILRARDGEVLIAGPRADLERWAQRAGLIRHGQRTKGALFEGIGKRLWVRSSRHWQRTVVSAGLGARVVVLAEGKMRNLVKDIRDYDPGPLPCVRKRRFPGIPQELTFVRTPMHLMGTPVVDVLPPPERGADTREFFGALGMDVPAGEGVVPYPKNKPLVLWLASFFRWGYFAWRSGNI